MFEPPHPEVENCDVRVRWVAGIGFSAHKDAWTVSPETVQLSQRPEPKARGPEVDTGFCRHGYHQRAGCTQERR